MRPENPQRIAGEALKIIEDESIFRGIAAGRCDMHLGAPDRAHGRGFACVVHGGSRGSLGLRGETTGDVTSDGIDGDLARAAVKV